MELTKLTTIPGSEKNISMTNVDNFERSDNFYNSLTPKKHLRTFSSTKSNFSIISFQYIGHEDYSEWSGTGGQWQAQAH